MDDDDIYMLMRHVCVVMVVKMSFHLNIVY